MAAGCEAHQEHGPKIFAQPLPTDFLTLTFDIVTRAAALARGTNVLHRALEDRLGTTTLGDMYATRGIALAIPTVEMSQHRALDTSDNNDYDFGCGRGLME
jgi:hypothetical protein